MQEQGMWRELDRDFDEVAAALPAALAAEGFGIITQIDLKQTFKDKLQRDVPRYKIFGACNPALAFEAIGVDQRIGLRLPCNVVVHERDGGGTAVGAIDPVATLGEQSPQFRELSERVRAKLSRAIDSLR